jgi:ADP-heptose:LPS heptosyltransferase
MSQSSPCQLAALHEAATNALAELRRLRQAGQLAPNRAARLAAEAAAALWQGYAAFGSYVPDAATALAELATQEDPELARLGLQALFAMVVERLGDAFDPAACAIYDRLFVDVIQHCRRLPAGAPLDAALRRFGLDDAEALLSRARRVRATKRFASQQLRQIKRAFVLSRVTLGAEVAVTSVVLAALKRACPAAMLTLVASPKARQLFAGDPRITLYALDYDRGGGLLDRLASWLQLVEAIRREVDGLDRREYLIVDPDSRLTQLGLLPLVPDESRYAFFESRSYRAPGLHKISELTAHWLEHAFGVAPPLFPYVALSPGDLAFARGVAAALRTRRRPVVSMNLGVGANPAKRLPDPFELTLLRRLLREGATILLDSGAAAEEVARVQRLSAACAGDGAWTVELDERQLPSLPAAVVERAQLITWRGSIGRFAALIGQSDIYVGYDSAGQHLAAAQGVPTVDIFTGFSSPRMPERWAPHGPGPVCVLVVGEAGRHDAAQHEALVQQIVAHVRRVGRS